MLVLAELFVEHCLGVQEFGNTVSWGWYGTVDRTLVAVDGGVDVCEGLVPVLEGDVGDGSAVELWRQPSVGATAIDGEWAGEALYRVLEFTLLKHLEGMCHCLNQDVSLHGTVDGTCVLANAFGFLMGVDDAGDGPGEGAVGLE